MGVRVDKAIGVVLALIGVSMLLLAADLAVVAGLVWTSRMGLDVLLLSAIGIAAVVFGGMRITSRRR